MQDKRIEDYALYRLEKSADDLDTARIDFEAGKYNEAGKNVPHLYRLTS